MSKRKTANTKAAATPEFLERKKMRSRALSLLKTTHPLALYYNHLRKLGAQLQPFDVRDADSNIVMTLGPLRVYFNFVESNTRGVHEVSVCPELDDPDAGEGYDLLGYSVQDDLPELDRYRYDVQELLDKVRNTLFDRLDAVAKRTSYLQSHLFRVNSIDF